MLRREVRQLAKKLKSGSTIGVGYVSIMLIFTVICLTIFAVLSFQAAYSDSRLSARSEGFTQKYYTADAWAKEILAELDSISYNTAGEPLYEELFAEAAAAVDGVTIHKTAEGIQADYSVEMTGNQSLSVSVLFYSRPDGERYEILRWQALTQDADGDSHQNVWDGGDLFN